MNTSPLLPVATRAVAYGVVGTLTMDLANSAAHVLGLTYNIDYAVIGALARGWLNGVFTYGSITDVSVQPADYGFGLVAHYVIGAVLAVVPALVYPALAHPFRARHWLLYGTATAVLSLFVLYPAVGLGFAAIHSPQPLFMIGSNLYNHFMFGVGLAFAQVIANGAVKGEVPL